MRIDSIQALRALYPHAKGRAKDKVLAALEEHSRRFIQNSPFLVLSTQGEDGMDVSPRGGAPGFVHVLDDRTLALPDARGNNRLDSLENILAQPRVGLLFLIPGMDETLRVNGRAVISCDPQVLGRFEEQQHPPCTAILVTVEEVFLHCAKALMRSRLWDPTSRIERSEFPTLSEMMKAQLGDSSSLESQEDMLRRYRKDL